MSTQAAETWQALDVSRREIRLLILEPHAERQAPPVGRLSIVSLDDDPSYDAISYAWGLPGPLALLYLNGRRINVGMDVAVCFSVLRHKTEARAYWIDAVCIDQQNLEERGRQVELMRYIFGQAAVVRVWLGWELKPVEDFVKSIARFRSLAKKVRRISDIANDHDPSYLDMQVNALASQSWWSRLWIRQEVALAKTVHFHYNAGTMTLQQLEEWVGRLEMFDEAWKGTRLAFLRLFSKVTRLTRLRASIEMGLVEELVKLFAESRETNVADARDRVYGQLGIVSAILQQDSISADYALDTKQVYTNFAFSLMENCRSLQILNQASRQYNSIQALPTWVPDWTSRYNFESEKTRLSQIFGWFKATGSQPMPAPQLAAPTTSALLGVRGHMLGVVKMVGSVCEPSPIGPYQIRLMSEWSSLFGLAHATVDCTSVRNAPDLTGLPTNVNPRFAATMLRGVLWQGENGQEARRLENDEEAIPAFEAIMEAYAGGQMPFELQESWVTYMGGILNTRFFVDSKGRPGMGPPHCEPGDVLMLLLGGNVPYALRKSKDQTQANLYTYVGECYVHGVMDGEAFEEDMSHEIWLE